MPDPQSAKGRTHLPPEPLLRGIRWLSRREPRVLLFHRFGPRDTRKMWSAETFDRQIRFLRERFRIVRARRLAPTLGPHKRAWKTYRVVEHRGPLPDAGSGGGSTARSGSWRRSSYGPSCRLRTPKERRWTSTTDVARQSRRRATRRRSWDITNPTFSETTLRSNG